MWNQYTLVYTHLLHTGSYESYVRAILAPACAAPEQGGLGYRAVVVNFRGCKSPVTHTYEMHTASRIMELFSRVHANAHRRIVAMFMSATTRGECCASDDPPHCVLCVRLDSKRCSVFELRWRILL